MLKFPRFIALAFFACSLFAAPSISGITNAASFINSALPNSGIAPGSIFTIFGTGLSGPGYNRSDSLPRPTVLGDASVTIKAPGISVSAPMIYASASQVSAILPSSVPAGAATVSVSYNGVASPPVPMNVVTSNLGIFSLYGAGNLASTFHASGVPTGFFNPGRTGETVVLWGTGLGATQGDDASGAAGGDLGTPVQVFVGGVPATVVYRGRSAGSTGLDQINFVVPAGTYGCDVSLVVQTGTMVSNSMVMSVSADGSSCSEPLSVFNVPLAGPANSYKVGSIVLSEAMNASGSTDTLSAAFTHIGPPAIPQAFNSPGSCVVTHDTSALNFLIRNLDAGNSLTLASPGSLLTVPKNSGGTAYTATLPGKPTGSYTLTNGAGGADVGPFSVNFAAPAQLFTWSNSSSVAAPIDRTQPLTFQWTGGDPNGQVLIQFFGSYSTASARIPVVASCTVLASAGQFTVPANVLLSFPGDLSGFTTSGVSVSVFGYSGLQILNIPNLTLAYATTVVASTLPVSFR